MGDLFKTGIGILKVRSALLAKTTLFFNLILATLPVIACGYFEISSALQIGHRVELRGLGSFCVRQRKERIARNPRSGEKFKFASKKIPFFKAGKAFRALLNTTSDPKFSQMSSTTVQSHPSNVENEM